LTSLPFSSWWNLSSGEQVPPAPLQRPCAGYWMLDTGCWPLRPTPSFTLSFTPSVWMLGPRHSRRAPLSHFCPLPFDFCLLTSASSSLFRSPLRRSSHFPLLLDFSSLLFLVEPFFRRTGSPSPPPKTLCWILDAGYWMLVAGLNSTVHLIVHPTDSSTRLPNLAPRPSRRAVPPDPLPRLLDWW